MCSIFFQKLRKYHYAFGRIKEIFYFDMRSVVQSKMTHTCRKSELIQTFYLVLNSEVRDIISVFYFHNVVKN